MPPWFNFVIFTNWLLPFGLSSFFAFALNSSLALLTTLQEKKLSEDNVKDLSTDLQVAYLLNSSFLP